MRWIDRLKSLETADDRCGSELPKLSKAAFGTFDSAVSHQSDKNSSFDVRRRPLVWNATHWHDYFQAQVATATVDGRQSDADARHMAWEKCVVHWLNLIFVHSDSSHCAHCGKSDVLGDLLPFGTEPQGHTWLHPQCWPEWYGTRKANAVAALKAIGIQPPAQFPDDLVSNENT